MKVRNKKLIACVCALSLITGITPYCRDIAENVSITASAEETTVLAPDQLEYVTYDDYVHIKGLAKTGERFSGAIEFPSEIDGLPVTVIGDDETEIDENCWYYAYQSKGYGLSSVTAIVLPDTVKSIKRNTFYFMYNLETIEIPSSVTEIGDMAFAGCKALKKLYIPEDGADMKIGNASFVGCAKLTELNLPNRVTSVGGGCFAGCTNLQYVTLSENMTQLYNYSPDSALSLDDVNYGAKFGFFEKCPSIKEIVLPDKIASIDDRAFTGCTGLEKITIGAGVTSLTGIDFDMETLKEINVSENNTMYSSDANGVLLNKDKTELLRYPKASDTVEYTVPDTVNTIKASAFSGAFNIKSVILPASVSKINLQSFYNCERLSRVTIENNACDIYLSSETFTAKDDKMTIYGHDNSKAQEYAEKYSAYYNFVSLDQPETDPTEPSTEPTETSTEPTEPSTEPTEPSTDPTEAVTDPTEPSTEPTEEILYGDANLDGKVNVRDCAFIASALANGETDSLPVNADFNNDGKINVRDAAAIAAALANGEL